MTSRSARTDDDSTGRPHKPPPAGSAGTLRAFWPGGELTLPVERDASVSVGRGADNTIRITHASVSRHHARIELAKQPKVIDLGSHNGTAIAGTPIRGDAPLAPGQVITLGDAVLVWEQARGKSTSRGVPPPSTFIVRDPEMARLHELARLVARGDVGVLLFGETGVGKEIFAHAIHAASPRAARPLTSINCAALPEPLLEAELFGYERGAFTGATQAKPGLLESAQGGTALLDEIGELPAATQAKLLRVLEMREATRLGGVRPIKLDVRFLAATNRDLEAMVAAGRFRADLFYRLNAVTLRIPALRERVTEIELLAERFLAAASVSLGRPIPSLASDARARLRDYPWPGNVRQLKNAMDAAALVAVGSTVEVAHLPLAVRASATSRDAAPSDLHAEREALERRRVEEALTASGGNQTEAAKRLGIARRTLVSWIEQWNLPRPRKRR